ncbi:GGDEF domain-containing protein [Actinomarinicola tropica]|uniref:Diguanylate cyclase n=1 Tax=Actinomarinicola tropica TaxID=2789776 RepID=A0A5Q2RI75_9ACTN|nr:GGDEF domain-containing protein [Actinomarinicola tropica]QGG96568.1 diguanylate cyclase [Actinomarinicola tropica]
MTDRRFLLAVGGALVGAIGGAAAAVNGAPIAGLAAAIGAVVAGAGVLLSPADPRDLPGPTAASTAVDGDTADAPTASTETHHAPATSAAPVEAVQNAAVPAMFGPPPAAPTPDAATPPPTPGEPTGQPPLLIDPTTGLFSEDYFNIAIEARLAAARRHLRPVGVVLIDVVEGLRVDRVRPADPQRVADAVRATLREADTACRRPDGKFALLLEDTPENGAIWTVERIRRRLVDSDASLTVWAGIACYPAHAFDKESILRSADQALDAAREWRQDRIEVAAGD